MRVFETVKELAKKPSTVLLTASIMHDVGKSKLDMKKIFHGKELITDQKEWETHPIKSVPIARRILKSLGHSNEFINEVSGLIKNHDNRSLKDKSFELKILQDADLLADMGLADFIRPFLWGGKFDRSVISCIQFMLEQKQGKDINKLNLPASKKLCKKQYKIKEELAKRIIKLLDSELIK
jgi:HD superfamily phosphodiesterase